MLELCSNAIHTGTELDVKYLANIALRVIMSLLSATEYSIELCTDDIDHPKHAFLGEDGLYWKKKPIIKNTVFKNGLSILLHIERAARQAL